jgi:hypothetical protein
MQNGPSQISPIHSPQVADTGNEKRNKNGAPQNFIGVPPNLTESSHKTEGRGEFVDEEEEEEA